MCIQPWQKLLNHYEVNSFVKIDLNIQLLKNKYTMLLLSIICQHNSQCIIKIIYNRTMICLYSEQNPLNVELIFTQTSQWSNNFCHGCMYMHGISSALLSYMQHFSAGAFNSVPMAQW